MRLAIVVASLLFATPVYALEVDFSAVMTDLDGAPIPDCNAADCEGKPPLTLAKIASRVLTTTFSDERDLPGEEKLKRGELATRVYKGGVVALKVEDASLLKKLIAKGYGPLIVLRTWTLLDPSGK